MLRPAGHIERSRSVSPSLPARLKVGVAATMLAAALCSAQALAAPAKGGAANLAMIGEPQTLDPMASTADLVSIIMQHVYEPLYTFDGNWNVAPMLAESMPTISKDGLVYTIPLRKGVKFHNGKEMTVRRCRRVTEAVDRTPLRAARPSAKEIKSLEAKGPNSIVITLNRPYAPLARALWHCRTGFAAIMAKDSIATPLTQFIGTGPYMFKERKPDQYVQLVRYAGYSARKEPAERIRRQARSAGSTSCASFRCPTRIRGSRDRCPGNTSSRTCCRSNRTRDVDGNAPNVKPDTDLRRSVFRTWC